MLRIAVPNKGSLSEPAAEMLREAGYRSAATAKELVLADPDNDVEFFFLRPRDIAVYVGAGTLDVGITGRDLLLDSGSRGRRGHAARASAAPPSASPPGRAIADVGRPTSPASASPPATRAGRGVPRPSTASTAEVVRLDGAVETAVAARASPTPSPTSSRPAPRCAAGLEVFGEPILRSEAVLIRPRGRHETGGRRRPASAACRACWSPGST